MHLNISYNIRIVSVKSRGFLIYLLVYIGVMLGILQILLHRTYKLMYHQSPKKKKKKERKERRRRRVSDLCDGRH